MVTDHGNSVANKIKGLDVKTRFTRGTREFLKSGIFSIIHEFP